MKLIRHYVANAPMLRRWSLAGDGDVLPIGAAITVLALDLTDPDTRKACWVRWQEGRDAPSYRSCDLSDLDLTDEAYEALIGK